MMLVRTGYIGRKAKKHETKRRENLREDQQRPELVITCQPIAHIGKRSHRKRERHRLDERAIPGKTEQVDRYREEEQLYVASKGQRQPRVFVETTSAFDRLHDVPPERIADLHGTREIAQHSEVGNQRPAKSSAGREGRRQTNEDKYTAHNQVQQVTSLDEDTSRENRVAAVEMARPVREVV